MRERNKRESMLYAEGKRLMDIDELCHYASLGRNSAATLGKDAEAVVRVGRRVLYDKKKIDAYIEILSE